MCLFTRGNLIHNRKEKNKQDTLKQVKEGCKTPFFESLVALICL